MSEPESIKNKVFNFLTNLRGINKLPADTKRDVKGFITLFSQESPEQLVVPPTQTGVENLQINFGIFFDALPSVKADEINRKKAVQLMEEIKILVKQEAKKNQETDEDLSKAAEKNQPPHNSNPP